MSSFGGCQLWESDINVCTSALWGAPRHAVVKIYIYIIIEVRTRCCVTGYDAYTRYSGTGFRYTAPAESRVGVVRRTSGLNFEIGYAIMGNCFTYL